MKQKINFNNSKGITLIALVVTIVVLLILAGISINLILGENGLISKARDAKEKTEQDAVNTEKALNNLYDEMMDILGENGNSGEGSTAKTLVQAFNDGEIKVGDYLNYSDYLNASNTYTSVTNENGWVDQTYSVDTETQWRVLGLSKNGTQLMLTSSSPIKKDMNASSENEWDQDPYLYMKGAYSYVNCEKMLNDISGIYSTSLGTARSITADDINHILGITVTSDGVYQKDDPTTNIDGWGVLGNSYTYTSSDYTPESYINGKTNATEGEIVDTSAYYYLWGDLTINSTIQEMLFAGTTSDSNYSKSYWLASLGVDYDSSYCFGSCFGPGCVDNGRVDACIGLFSSYGNWHAFRYAVRPVVCLNSDVSVDQLHVISGEVETWTYNNSDSNLGQGNASNGESGNHTLARTTSVVIKPQEGLVTSGAPFKL